jgi:hypothetical protein
MKSALLCLGLLLAATAAAPTEPDGKPTVLPAVLKAVTPTGVVRGVTTTLTLEGSRLAGALGIFFDDPAISGKVLPAADPKNMDQVRVEAKVGGAARIGIHRLFVQTPLGTTGAVSFAVGGWPEVKPLVDSSSLRVEGSVKASRTDPSTLSPQPSTTVPVTVSGSLEKPGDVGEYRFEARAGQELVFQVIGASIRSKLNAVLTLTDASGRVLAEANSSGSRPEPVLGHRIAAAGTYTIRLRDFENASGADVYYRLNIGEFPVVTGAYPLGLRRGTSQEVRLTGYNLGGQTAARVTALDETPAWGKTMPLPGKFVAAPRLAVGEDAEVEEAEPNGDLAHAQRVTVPITVNGHIAGGRAGAPDADEYRFRARRGHPLILDVAARRLGSPLDSLIEVLDARGHPIERATLRPVAEATLVLSNRDSSSGSFRVGSWTDLAVNDYIAAGRELLQITRIPEGPDEEVSFRNFRGARLGLMDTTPEAHSIGSTIYKVQIAPPGRSFPSNGMPLFRLYYQNDDGGGLYGKDSRVTFDPPADGEYVVRLTDVRGQQGADYAYRLSIHPPRPDFKLTLSPENPNVQRGSSVPVTAGIERYDGFDGPVDVRLEGLPPGFSAAPGTIAAGADSAILLLAASPTATTPTLPVPSPIRLVGRAFVGGREVVRAVEPENGVRLLTVLPEPDIRVATDVRQVTLRPGERVEIVAQVERRNGFKGRVPIDVRNLPFGVAVRYVGLNGVLITEQQTSRRFVIAAEPWAKPQTRPFFAVGRVESEPSTEVGSEPIMLTVQPAATQASR